MSAFLGIDAGNTGVKAVLFDEGGRALASAHRDTGGQCPAPGMVERDIGRLRTDLDGLVREVLDKSGLKGSDIAGIGTSGHGNGLYLLDADGGPVAAIQSLDTRAAGVVEEWNGNGVADAAEAICLQRPWAAQTPASARMDGQVSARGCDPGGTCAHVQGSRDAYADRRDCQRRLRHGWSGVVAAAGEWLRRCVARRLWVGRDKKAAAEVVLAGRNRRRRDRCRGCA